MRMTKPISVRKSTKTARVATVNKTMRDAVPVMVNKTSTLTKGRILKKTKTFKGFDPDKIQGIPQKARYIGASHKTMRKLLTTMRHVGAAAFGKLGYKKPSIKVRADTQQIKEVRLSRSMIPKSSAVILSSSHAHPTRNVDKIHMIEKRLSRGINKGSAKQSPLSTISTISTSSTSSTIASRSMSDDKKDDAKSHLQNKKNGVVTWKYVW